MNNNWKPDSKENSAKKSILETKNQRYATLLWNLSKRALTTEEQKEYEECKIMFEKSPALYYITNMLKEYRNTLAHHIVAMSRDDAKLAIVAFLKILSGLDESQLLDKVFIEGEPQ